MRPFEKLGFAYLLALQVLLAVFWHSDPLLSNPDLSTHPYPPLWFWANQYWNSGHLYLYTLLPLQLAASVFLLQKFRRGRMSLWALYLSQFMNVFLVLAADPESVVPIQFAYLGSPLALALSALFRFPWTARGWAYVLYGPHPEFWWNLMVRSVTAVSVAMFFLDWLRHRRVKA